MFPHVNDGRNLKLFYEIGHKYFISNQIMRDASIHMAENDGRALPQNTHVSCVVGPCAQGCAYFVVV